VIVSAVVDVSVVDGGSYVDVSSVGFGVGLVEFDTSSQSESINGVSTRPSTSIESLTFASGVNV